MRMVNSHWTWYFLTRPHIAEFRILLIPRITADQVLNDRLNARRRAIHKKVSPAQTQVCVVDSCVLVKLFYVSKFSCEMFYSILNMSFQCSKYFLGHV
jgi:hypothetical protein